ncbi:hypothetical protein [Acinetobacter sp. LMB-5]|uniref:hypothetical protein n=1 Tax=Acinetobacter sp. LMB-5 TaxID=1609919 RepID=UPI000761857F|nr:hypothetical protein [Acinetobacter sp. LMB-5]
MKILILSIVVFITQIAIAESPMQPASKEYDYCNKTGTTCGVSFIEKSFENGQMVNSVGTIDDSNEEQLLNLDHYYRKECLKFLGLSTEYGVPNDKKRNFGKCLIEKLTIAIENRNLENAHYLERTMQIFE